MQLIWYVRLEKSLYFVELRASIGQRSKLLGDFPAETSRDEENIFYAIDSNWTGASMVYAHILRDSDDNAMTVCFG